MTDLYPSPEDESFRRDFEEIVGRTREFSTKYHGKISSMNPAELFVAVSEYEQINETVRRLGAYTHLHWTTDTLDQQRGSLLQRVRERITQAWQHMIFFDTEFNQLSDEEAQVFISAPELTKYASWLEGVRLYKNHTLTEAEEKILSEKSVTGRQAWVRYFDEVLNSLSFPFEGRKLSQGEILAKLYSADRSVRKKAVEIFSTELKKISRTQAYIFNTVLADCASNDRLRNFPSWISARNLNNEISDEAVEALVSTVRSRYDIVGRFYTLKKKLLGLEELYEWDRYAPVSESEEFWTWDEARELVTDSYATFLPEFGSIVREFFDKKWIDGPPKHGKRSGAFSASTVPSVHPYIMMNYTGRTRDVQTLAHELGHGVHQYLSRSQGLLNADTPLTLAETASIFGEMMVFSRLLEATKSEKEKLWLLMDKIDDTVATVFRQISLNRFEHSIHTARRSEGELSIERLSELWLKNSQEMFGDSVTLTDNYGIWWSYISHFIHTPGYVYAYSFGELLVLALYEKYKQEGDSFKEKYRTLLSSGGSQRPEILLAPMGVDVNDPEFWHQGLALIEGLVTEAEMIAERLL